MTPLISVIVPVYNVEEYLDRCVESIVNQTYQNLEIILVDDGSTDSSGKKCDKWANKDKRIIVIHKENGGQAEARNYGLERATGEYIGFVDSDDLIDLEMYQLMYQCLTQNHADIVECAMTRFSNQNEEPLRTGNGSVIVFKRADAIKDFIAEKHLTCTVPNMLLKAEIAKNVLFDVGKTHEDILWPYRVFCLSNRIVFIDFSFYFYYQRAESTMNRRYSEKRFDGLDAFEIRANYVKNDFPDLYPRAIRSYLGGCMYHYQFLCRQPKCEEYMSYKSILHHRFCDGDQTALFDGLGIKYKFWYSFFRKAPNLTCKIRNKLKIGL